MSEDRRSINPDIVEEIAFDEFIARCMETSPDVRVQGKDYARTHGRGRLVRFNRLVRVAPSSLSFLTGEPRVMAARLRRNRFGELVPTGEWMLVVWHELDYVNWYTGTGDPNGSWVKVTYTTDAASAAGSPEWDVNSAASGRSSSSSGR